jgi:hypothetical protein
MSYLAKKMGFRLVMWSAEPESNTVAAGEGLSVSMTWENKGIAPPYRDFRVAFRLKDSSGNVINGSTVISDLTVQGWLPGPAFFNSAVYNVPSGIAAGNYNLEIGVVFHADAGTVLPIVVNERNDDFWVPVPLGGSELTVTSNDTGGSSSSQIPSSYLQAVVPSNFNSAGKIIDGNTASSSGSWHNTNGIVADAEFEIKLNRRFNLTSLEYFDEHYRNLEITIFDGVNQVSQFNTTHSSANNGTLFTINNGDGHLATKVKIRNTAVYQGTSWLAPIEVKLNGIRVEDSFQRIEPGNENSLTAASNAPLWRIIDGLTSTGSWSNEGLPNEAHVDLYLEQTRKIFAVVYEDQYPRKLEVGIWNNGNLVSQQSFDTQSGYNELEVSDIVGDTVKIWSTNDYLSNGELWLSPKEIRVFGFPD